MWVVKGFYRMISVFVATTHDFEIHEVVVVFFCRFIGFLLQMCGSLYFIRRLLGRPNTALVESITKNYSYVQLFNVGFTTPILMFASLVYLIKWNTVALACRFGQLVTNLLYAVIHVIVCDIFLSWPDDNVKSGTQSGGSSPGTPAGPTLQDLQAKMDEKMPGMKEGLGKMKESMAKMKDEMPTPDEAAAAAKELQETMRTELAKSM